MSTSKVSLACLTTIAALAAPATAGAQIDPGVNYDSGSPAGKEYAIPLVEGRSEGAGTEDQQAGANVPFGVGIDPPAGGDGVKADGGANGGGSQGAGADAPQGGQPGETLGRAERSHRGGGDAPRHRRADLPPRARSAAARRPRSPFCFGIAGKSAGPEELLDASRDGVAALTSARTPRAGADPRRTAGAFRRSRTRSCRRPACRRSRPCRAPAHRRSRPPGCRD